MLPSSIARATRVLLAVSIRSAPVAAVVAVAAVAPAAACGGAPASPQAPASSAGPVASVALPPPPDLTPVAPPPGLVVSGTLSKIGASLATVGGWTQLPMPASESVTEILAGEGLGAIADLDRPVLFAVAVTGSGARLRALVAVSAGVRDLEAAKAALGAHHKLVPGENGALVIQGAQSARHPKGGDDEDEGGGDEDTHACELAPAYGDAANRLVCALDAKSLAALGPWLTRGATREHSPNDAHVDVRMQPLRQTISEEKRLFAVLLGSTLGGRLGMSSVRELAQAVGGDLADFGTDLETASLDVVLSDPGAAATMTMKLTGSASTLGRLLTANADHNGPPPAAFWQLPPDADFALFDRGVDAAAMARARDLGLKVVEDVLAEQGVKDADRHAVVDAAGKMMSSAPMLYASGVDVDAARKALAADKALPDGADVVDRREASRASAQALLGWRVIEIDEPASPRVDAMKAFAAAWAKVSAACAAKGARCVAVRVAPVPKGSPLPKDAQRFALDVPLPEPIAAPAPKGKAKAAGTPKPLAVDLYVVPDGARTWIGLGDAALVPAKLAGAIAGSGDGLRARPEIAAMKDAVIGAGGFFTARGIPEIGEQASAFGVGGPGGFGGGADLFDALAQLPHQGTTPIPFTLTAPAATPGTAVMTLQVPRGTIDDVVMLIMKHGF